MADSVLDLAHARMQAVPEDPAARLGFYEKLVGSELFMLLEAEPEGDQITPRVFEVGGEAYVLVFDREDRLGSFAGAGVPYAALSGRGVCAMLAPAGLGLGLNLDVAPSSILLPPEALAWIAQMEQTPEAIEARIEAFHAPVGLPDTLVAALDARLAAAGGLADMACLVGVTYKGGAAGHLLGFVDAQPQAQAALAASVAQALAFCGQDATVLDVGFFGAADPVSAHLARHGLRFDLPEPGAERRAGPASGSGRPPRLK